MAQVLGHGTGEHAPGDLGIGTSVYQVISLRSTMKNNSKCCCRLVTTSYVRMARRLLSTGFFATFFAN